MASSIDRADLKDLKDRFDVSGPIHMMRGPGGSSAMKIDWESEEHRRCIAACLVQGTYVLERDRSTRRYQAKALAPAWYESFHFSKMEVLELEDDSFLNCHNGDKFIFGAIYKHVGAPPRHPSAPQYVAAFRGTMPRHAKDVVHDCRILCNCLKKSKRFQIALAAVNKLLATIAEEEAAGPDQNCDVVWLAGHSLGASLALEVGRTKMVEQGLSLPTFLFNPPQVSLAPVINKLHLTKAAKSKMYDMSHLVKAGLGLAFRRHRERMEDIFERLSPWAPKLYVHEEDIICQGFINYFEQRDLSAMTLSYRDMFFSLLRKKKERPHLLPSAMLWKNSSMDSDAHGLKQWWKSNGELSLSPKYYSYPVA